MVPTLALTTGLLALLLSIVAIVLATVANRRHMAARRDRVAVAASAAIGATANADPQPGTNERAQALSDLRGRIDALDELVAGLSSSVEQLAEPVAARDLQLAALGDQVGTLPERLAALDQTLADLRAQQEVLRESADETRAQAVESSTLVGVLAEQSAVVLDRSDRVQARLEATEERAAEHAGIVMARVDSVTSQVAALSDHVLGADPTALRHVAVVRYDAFADVGGRLSYSLAVLDDTASGFVVTTLAGKAEVRTYVRAIWQGASDGSLTAEEQQAIGAARQEAGSRP